MPDRVLLVATYRRTLAPVRERRIDQVTIVTVSGTAYLRPIAFVSQPHRDQRQDQSRDVAWVRFRAATASVRLSAAALSATSSTSGACRLRKPLRWSVA